MSSSRPVARTIHPTAYSAGSGRAGTPVRARWVRVLLSTALVAVGLPAVFAGGAQGLAPITVDTGVWQANGRVNRIIETPTAIYLAGRFTALIGPGGQTLSRPYLAALSPAGEPLAFNPQPNKQVHSLALSPDGTTLYFGGDFSKVSGQARGRVAAVNAATGVLRPLWDPKADARVYALATLGSTVYLAGDFAALGTTPRSRLAAVSAVSAPDTTPTVDPAWTPTADDSVRDIVVTADGRLLAGGFGVFRSSDGAGPQRRLAALHPVTGRSLPWQTHPTYPVLDISVSPTQVFLAGGGSGGHAAAFDLTTGAQQWLSLGDGDAQAICYQNGVAYIGGHFNMWRGLAAKHFVAADAKTGATLTWPVYLNSALGIFAMDCFRGHLSFGGDFTTVRSSSRQHFARITEAYDAQPPSAPGQPVAVDATTTSITVGWPAAADDIATALTYRLYRDGGATPVGQVTSSSTGQVTFTDTGLRSGASYTYVVIADDGTNLSEPSPASLPLSTVVSDQPTLTTLEAFDTDIDGRVDRLVASFSVNVSCSAPCRAPWTLADFSTGVSLREVTLSGQSVTLDLNQGSAPRHTDVGTATLALSGAPGGITGPGGGVATFGPTSPADRMAPIAIDVTSTNGQHDNVMEPGDTFTVTFSEPIDPTSVIAANIKQLDPPGVGNDGMIVVGLSDGPIDLGSDNYVLPDGGTAIYTAATLTMLSGNTRIRSTVVGACTGTACAALGTGALATLTFAPEPILRDMSGNSATGTYSEEEGVF